MKKRLISLLLAMLMLFSLLPTAAFAGDEAVTEEIAEEQVGEEHPAASEETAETAEEPAEEPAEEQPEEVTEETSEEPAALAEGQPTEEPEATLEGQNILTAENFPDANLLAYLLEECSGSLTANDALALKALFLEDLNISDFTGINTYCTAIEELDISGNPVKSLDVSALSRLEELDCTDCANLSSLTLPEVSTSQLQYLWLGSTAITSLDLSGCTGLEEIEIYSTPIKSLDVSALSELTYLDCGSCAILSSLTLPASKSKLGWLYLDGTAISSLELSGYSALSELYCSQCSNLSRLDCSGCSGLETLKAAYSALESVTLSGCVMLESINVEGNRLSGLDVTDCTGLTSWGLSNQFPGSSITVWKYPDIYGMDTGYYIDFPADGFGTPNAGDITITCSEMNFLQEIDFDYDNNGCFLLNPDDVGDLFSGGSCYLNISIKCTGFNGEDSHLSIINVNNDLTMNLEVQLKTGCPISFPEEIVLSTDDTDGVEFKLSKPDGTVIDPAVCGYELQLADYSSDTVEISGNTIKPLKAGHATLVLMLYMANGGNVPVMVSTVAVDVVDGKLSNEEDAEGNRSVGSGVEAVNLMESQVTVELYKTDYSELNLELQLEQNYLTSSLSIVPEDELDVPADLGYAIKSAEFTGDAADWFDLVPTSDAKLRIVPKYEKIESVYNGGKAPGSFTTQVRVQLSDGGEPFTTDKLKITLKKTTPKVTAKAIVLNSWDVNFTIDDYIFAVEPQISVTPAAKVKDISIVDDSLPAWATLYYDSGYRLAYTGGQYEKHSANLKFELELEGYAVKPQVTIKLSSKSTAPTVKASASKVTLLDNNRDSAFVSVSAVMSGSIGDISKDYRVYIDSVTEGKNTVPWEGSTHCEENPRLTFSENSSYITGFSVKASSSDGNKHTYKVNYHIADKKLTLTVNVLPANASSKPSITVKGAKNSGVIELDDETSTGFTVSGKNCGIDTKSLIDLDCNDELSLGEDYNFYVYDNKKNDVTEEFNLSFNDDSEYITLVLTGNSEQLEPGKYTFKLIIYSNLVSQAEITGSCTFEVKQYIKKTVKLKSTGTLQAYQESFVTISATASNFDYLYEFSESEFSNSISIYSDKACTDDVSDSFYYGAVVTGRPGPQITIGIADYAAVKPGTYYVRYEHREKIVDEPDILSAPLKLTVKADLPKVTLGAKQVYLSTKDCYDTAYIDYTDNSCRVLEMVEFTDSKMAQFFTVEGYQNHSDINGEGQILISWSGAGRMTQKPEITLKAKTTKTVKLNLWYEGMAKPVIVSVKVVVK